MTTTVKAERNTITLAGIPIDVFILPDGSYKYSLTSATGAIGRGANDWANYKRSALYAGNREETLVAVGRTRVRVLDDIEVASYWQWKAINGNIEAIALVTALSVEAMSRRSDRVIFE